MEAAFGAGAAGNDCNQRFIFPEVEPWQHTRDRHV